MEPMLALLACFRWTSQFHVDRLAGKSCWDLIAERIQKGSADRLTISTLGSADTIPLGTDLDPHNGYSNLWAAGKVNDPNYHTDTYLHVTVVVVFVLVVMKPRNRVAHVCLQAMCSSVWNKTGPPPRMDDIEKRRHLTIARMTDQSSETTDLRHGGTRRRRSP